MDTLQLPSLCAHGYCRGEAVLGLTKAHSTLDGGDEGKVSGRCGCLGRCKPQGDSKVNSEAHEGAWTHPETSAELLGEV